MPRLILEDTDGQGAVITSAHVCESFDQAGVCTSWVSVEVQERPVVGGSVLPPMSIADSATILSGAFLIWSIAWGFREIVRLIRGEK